MVRSIEGKSGERGTFFELGTKSVPFSRGVLENFASNPQAMLKDGLNSRGIGNG